MLSFVVDELASNDLIHSEFIHLVTKENVYSDKDLLNLLNVDIDSKELGKTYGSINQKYRDVLDNSQNSTMWSSSYEISKSKIEDSDYIEENKVDESTKASTFNQQMEITDDLMEYIKAWFFKKYEQANFSNIRKTGKFWNAMHHLIRQTFESKKFKKIFPEYEWEEEILERVSLYLIYIFTILLDFYFSKAKSYHINLGWTTASPVLDIKRDNYYWRFQVESQRHTIRRRERDDYVNSLS